MPDEQTPLLNGAAETGILADSSNCSCTCISPSGTSRGLDEETPGGSSPNDTGLGPKTSTGMASIISVLLLGCFIANADGSVILATYATISSETGNLGNGSWLVVSYMLAVCAIQPTVNKLFIIKSSTGKLKRKGLLVCLFTVGCAVCGAGQNFWQVALGRTIAGLGGAGMTSLVSVLIADKVPLRDVATWRSFVNVASTVGRSAGGPIGGFLADIIGWRWSFYIQCPLTVTAIILVAWKLDGRSNHTTTAAADDETKTAKRKLHRIDFLGSISLALAIVGFLLAKFEIRSVLDLGGQKLPWDHPLIWIIFAAAGVCSLVFTLVEAFVAREPIFPLRLIVHRDIISAYLVTALLGTAQFGVMYTVPLYFQVTARASIANAGAHLFPAVCGNAIAGIISGAIIKKTASYKILTIVGTLSSILSYLLLLFLWRGNTSFWESICIAPGGFGMGIILSTTFIYFAAGVDESQMAIASTGLYLSNNIGVLVGASLASNILQTSFKKGLSRRLKIDWKNWSTVSIIHTPPIYFLAPPK
ncbi:MAG: hypothetical protein Q9213_002207 [Squamulea squamosa]